MLYWIITFMILSLIAGFFGFSGIAAASGDIAQLLFYIFVLLFVISIIVAAIKNASKGQMP